MPQRPATFCLLSSCLSTSFATVSALLRLNRSRDTDTSLATPHRCRRQRLRHFPAKTRRLWLVPLPREDRDLGIRAMPRRTGKFLVLSVLLVMPVAVHYLAPRMRSYSLLRIKQVCVRLRDTLLERRADESSQWTRSTWFRTR